MQKNILLTGAPGIGKTTLIKKIISNLDFSVGGFYTEEIRRENERVGFKILTLDRKEGILAHKNLESPYRVGKYGVNIKDLEEIAAESIKKAVLKDKLIVIDELGRMELYSKNFQDTVISALNSEKCVLGTIQMRENEFLNKIRKRDDVKIFTVTIENRDFIHKDI